MATQTEAGNVQDLVEIKDIRDGTVILKNGGLRQIVMVGGINFSLKSEEEQNIITQGYQEFLNSVSFPLQIIVHSRKVNIERYVNRLDELRAKEPSALLQDQISEYQEFVRGFIKDNAIMAKTFLVVVPFTPISLPSVASSSSSLIDSLPFLSRKKTPEKSAEAAAERTRAQQTSFEESVAQLKQRVNQVAQGLTAVGLEAVVLNNEQLVELYYNFYNPETVERQETPRVLK